jgi:uncharacterized protein with PIN domain
MDKIDQDLETSPETETETEVHSGFYGNVREVVTRYSRCPLCAAHLHFTHSTDFSRNLTLETSKCPECSVQIRRMMHRLH